MSNLITFTYDAASRLKEAVNPESGTIGYTYDNNGNLATKTDARSVVTTYAYDTLNRVKTRSYSDSTPTVTYYYDGKGLGSAPSYSKGKLTKVSSSVSENKYTGFDNVGKLLASEQITDSNTYTFGYTYNLGGALLEETYPSGRIVKNTIDTDASLSKVETQPSGGSYATRAETFSYTAAGAVSSMKLGNAKWENAVFNSRLQPTQLGLGTSSTDQSLWKVNYDYGSTNNNGNVLSQTITVPTITAIVQTYTYDSLNRIKDATETVSSSPIWKQTFSYDRYGNRRFDTTGSNTTTIPGGCSTAQCNPTIDTANNRFTTGQGYTYDSSGNLLTDAEGRTFTYDAENKQKTAANSGGTIGTYSYDGDGKRVKKVSNAETTLFVYNASGKMVAEYLLTESTPSTPTTSYLTNDTLGSPRVITDASGNVTSRRDFMPFGEEISAIGGRTSGLGYQLDATRQKFTSYERDSETNLDYAINRYHSSELGRFTQTDPYNIILEKEKGKDEKEKQQIFIFYISQPQIWNKYVYSINNPLKLTDPDGRRPITDAERANIEKFKQSGYAYSQEKVASGEWTKEQAEQFRYRVDAASHVIENVILAVPTGQSDPRNLRVVLYSMSKLGDMQFSNNGKTGFDSNGANVQLVSGQNKCTFFVGVAYAKGGGIGWNSGGNKGGYQVDFWYRTWEYRVPVANSIVDNGLTNFAETAKPTLGDIAVGKGSLIDGVQHGGHGGIYISSDVVISANPDNGVRTGSFGSGSPASGFKYFTYKP